MIIWEAKPLTGRTIQEGMGRAIYYTFTDMYSHLGRAVYADFGADRTMLLGWINGTIIVETLQINQVGLGPYTYLGQYRTVLDGYM